MSKNQFGKVRVIRNRPNGHNGTSIPEVLFKGSDAAFKIFRDTMELRSTDQIEHLPADKPFRDLTAPVQARPKLITVSALEAIEP